MYFLFSGEGATDLGEGLIPDVCEGENYRIGPLVYFVDKIVFNKYKFSLLETPCFGFVSKQTLKERFDKRKFSKKFRFPRGDIEHERGTKYFRNNARALAVIAKELAEQKKDDVVAIFFRDSDTPDSNERKKKKDSILNGFMDEKFTRGVPMMPKPVSEAWLLCAIYRKKNANLDYSYLEDQKYGYRAEHELKYDLEDEIGGVPSRELLTDKIKNGEIQFALINLNSFVEFQERFKKMA